MIDNIPNTDFAYYIDFVFDWMTNNSITLTFNGETTTISWWWLYLSMALTWLGIWILEKILER